MFLRVEGKRTGGWNRRALGCCEVAEVDGPDRQVRREFSKGPGAVRSEELVEMERESSHADLIEAETGQGLRRIRDRRTAQGCGEPGEEGVEREKRDWLPGRRRYRLDAMRTIR